MKLFVTRMFNVLLTQMKLRMLIMSLSWIFNINKVVLHGDKARDRPELAIMRTVQQLKAQPALLVGLQIALVLVSHLHKRFGQNGTLVE